MNSAKHSFCVFTILVAGVFSLAGSTSAQTVAQKKEFLKKILDASSKIPAHHKRLLSTGAQNLLHIAERVNTKFTKPGIGDDGGLTNVPPQALRPHLKFLESVAGKV